ncbi:MAG: hypothetical protein RJA09_1119 [Pseudomonadota bacterium]
MSLHITRDPMGLLAVSTADGQSHTGVVAVRAFPVQNPEGCVSLMGSDGHEVAWVERLSDLPTGAEALVREALLAREFMPTIQRLVAVSSFATPSTWTVETDRGPTDLVLKGEEDIRRLGQGILLVVDAHGVQFLIRDLAHMDKHSRRLLDRFL